MSDTYDPDEPFKLDEEPEDVLRRLLGVEENEEPAEGEEDDS